MKGKIELSAFVNAYGQVKLANDLGVSRQAAYLWEKGQNFPTPPLAYKIIKLSNGLVDFNSIYLPFMKRDDESNASINKEG
jgi:DNA-binding XRE family transcriptional regulator